MEMEKDNTLVERYENESDMSVSGKNVTVDLLRLWCATVSRKSALISASQSVHPGTSTTLWDHGYGLVYHAMCLFTPPHFAGYSFQPATDGWVDLVPGSAPRWFTRPKTVTHPGTNRAWRRVTTLIKSNVLPLYQNRQSKALTTAQARKLWICWSRLIWTFGKLWQRIGAVSGSRILYPNFLLDSWKSHFRW